MTRNALLILAVALVLILGVVVLRQRSLIESLRASAPIEAAVAPPAAEIPEPARPPLIPSSASTPDLAEGAVLPPAITAAAPAVVAPVPLDRGLQEQLQQLEAELERTKRLIPEADDPKAAYVGPGVWSNVDPRTLNIRKVLLSGQARPPTHLSAMTIKVWGACTPVDCELVEVPFYLLDSPDHSARTYRRGFAAWEFEGGQRVYLLVTFEKAGLRIDKVSLHSGGATHRTTVDRMTRIQ